MTFQEQLISHRKRMGLSQEQLGIQIGVSRQTVSKWELGETTPEMKKLIQLSQLFEISIDELVGNESESDEPLDREKKVDLHFYRWHYEYKSKRSLFGLPLVHINIGHGFYKAKGILAIGSIARGIFSLGGISLGVVSLGGASCGLLSFGALALGILLAAGGISIGTIALGGFALGVLAMGGCAVGAYSMGGAAIAVKIAAGGYASAPIAIGDGTSGQVVFDINGHISSEEIRQAILEKFPHTWKFIVNLFSSIG